jgi:hypothetical protein
MFFIKSYFDKTQEPSVFIYIYIVESNDISIISIQNMYII